MNSILIDTNFYVDIMRGAPHAQKLTCRMEKIVLCPIVLGELLFGFKNGHYEHQNIERLHAFLNLPSVQVVPLTTKTSEFYALLNHQLKVAGTPIPTNDIWIAACAMEHGLALATSDQHFQKIHNLLLT